MAMNRFNVSQKEAASLGDALEWYADQPKNANISDDCRDLGDQFAEVAHRGTGANIKYEMVTGDQSSMMLGEILDGLLEDPVVLQKFPNLKDVSNRWLKYALGESKNLGENKKVKKSTYRVLAEAIAFGKLPELPNTRKFRKLQKEELTTLVKEGFEEVKKVEEVKVSEDGWENVELANELNWSKTLGLDKAFKK